MAKNTQITRPAAVALFIALGFNTAPKWKDDRLLTKLGQVKSKVDEDTELDDAEAQKTLDLVLKNTGEFELIDTDDDSVPAKKPTRRKKSKVSTSDKKPARKKASYTPTDKSKSNKAIAYKTWLDGEDDPEKIYKKVNQDEVQLKTVRLWLSNWRRGKNLPAIAKELPDPSKRQKTSAPVKKKTAAKTPVKKAVKKAPAKKAVKKAVKKPVKKAAKKAPAKKRARAKK